MRLGEFRARTKDLPDTAEIWLLDEGEVKAWKMPDSLHVIETQLRYLQQRQEIPESMQHQIEIRLRTA